MKAVWAIADAWSVEVVIGRRPLWCGNCYHTNRVEVCASSDEGAQGSDGGVVVAAAVAVDGGAVGIAAVLGVDIAVAVVVVAAAAVVLFVVALVAAVALGVAAVSAVVAVESALASLCSVIPMLELCSVWWWLLWMKRCRPRGRCPRR